MALSYMQDSQFATGFLVSQTQIMKKDVPADKHRHHLNHSHRHHQQTPSPPLNNNTASHNNNHTNPSVAAAAAAAAASSLLFNTMLNATPAAQIQLFAAMQCNPMTAAALYPALYTNYASTASSPPLALQPPGPVSPALSTKSSHSHGSRKSQPQHISHHHNNNTHTQNNNNIISSSISSSSNGNSNNSVDRLSDNNKKMYAVKRRANAAKMKAAAEARTAARQQIKIEGAASPASSGSPETVKDPSRDKVFTCGVCHRSFGYKHVLQNHERTHTGEKPFECKTCHKKFTRDHHLKTHMRLHTGEKPYACQHCDRTFVQVANLRRHLRVHTGERPYTCEVCDNKFSDSNQLKAHLLIHNEEKPWECKQCLQRFRRKHHREQHKCTGGAQQQYSNQINATGNSSSSSSRTALSLLPISSLKRSPTSSPNNMVKDELSIDEEDEDVEMTMMMGREAASGGSPGPSAAGLPLNLSRTPQSELMQQQPVQTEPEDLSMSGARSRALSGSVGGSSPASRYSGSEVDEEDGKPIKEEAYAR